MVTIDHLEQHRVALTGHCYRMLGSSAEAEDAVQETLVRAWKNLDRFEARASVRTWLHRIATNVCLDALSDRSRRHRPMELRACGTVDDELTLRPESHWIEPIADALAVPSDVDPSERLVLRQSIRLAFVAALQHLPPKQRAALLLTEVLGWSAAEVAESLETSVASVNSALQRARATLATRERLEESGPLSDAQVHLVDRYVEAFERYDLEALTSLLHHDAVLSMPPYDLWLQGVASIGAWLAGRGSGCRGSKLVATQACGSPAFGQYRASPDGTHRAWSLTVLELSGERIVRWNAFLDTARLFPRFGLPMEING